MKQCKTTLELIGALLLIVGFAAAPPSFAQGHDHAGMKHEGTGMNHREADEGMAEMMSGSPHRGSIHQTGEFRFETVFTESDVRVYVMDSSGKMVPTKGIEGSVTIQNPTEKDTIISLGWNSGLDDPVASNRARPGAEVIDSHGYLVAGADFRATADGAIDVHIMVRNLPGKEEKTARWSAPYKRTPLFGMACPMHPEVASLEKGTCPECGGMELQAADIFYECCEGCGEMRMTSPGTCYKCGMDLQPKAVDYQEQLKLAPAEPRHSKHSH